jgi:uncharacterized protein with HEPN domain
MRREELYLTDIVEATDAIQRFLKNIEQNTFLKDELLQTRQKVVLNPFW